MQLDESLTLALYVCMSKNIWERGIEKEYEGKEEDGTTGAHERWCKVAHGIKRESGGCRGCSGVKGREG